MGNSSTKPTASQPEGCPVDHTKAAPGECPVKHSTPATGECPVKHTSAPKGECPVKHSAAPGECPVQHDGKVAYNVYSQPIDPKNQMPLNPNQLPAVGQSMPLETERVQSSIPKGNTEGQTWTYPSPQMFYNALQRKGKADDVDEKEMDTVVAVHNNMNERTWRDVLFWESLHQDTCCSPRLLRFCGRPDDISPMAWIKSTFLGYPKPFDRHDWVIQRCGKEVRYIIDYYSDEAKAELDEKPSLFDKDSVKSIYFEVRPAVDSPEALFDRLRMPVLSFLGQEPSVEAMLEKERQQQAAEEATQHAAHSHAGHAHGHEGCPVDHGKKKAAPAPKLEDVVADEPSAPTTFDDLKYEDIKKYSQMFAENCGPSFKRLQECDTEDACIKANVALNYCMASMVCRFESNEFLKDTTSEENVTKMYACLTKFENKASELRDAAKES